jgi:hypothetical protein
MERGVEPKKRQPVSGASSVHFLEEQTLGGRRRGSVSSRCETNGEHRDG